MAAVVCLPSGPGRWGRPVFPALVSAVVRPGLSVKPARNTCARTPFVPRAHARQREHARPVCTGALHPARVDSPFVSAVTAAPPLHDEVCGLWPVLPFLHRGVARAVCARAARTCPVNKSPCGVHCTADRKPPVQSLEPLAVRLAPGGALRSLSLPGCLQPTQRVPPLNSCGSRLQTTNKTNI